MQYSQEHLKTMVYAKFGGQTECIMGNWKIENRGSAARSRVLSRLTSLAITNSIPGSLAYSSRSDG